MAEAARLSVVVTADTAKAQASLRSVQGSLDRSVRSALRTTAAFGGIAGAVAGFKKLADVTVEFDRNMRNVNSIAGLSEAKFQSLSKSVLKLGGQTAQSPRSLADGLYDLVSSGFKANDSLTILKSSARAATAGLTDTATSTKAVAGVLNAYHLKANDAAKVSDDLFQTVNLGVLSFQDLAQGIGPVLPFAAKLGVSLKQVGAMTATLTKNGVPAAEAFTYQKGAMAALIKPTDQLKESYKKLGASSGQDLIHKTGSLQGALKALYDSVGQNTQKFSELFPDLRGMTAAFSVVGKGAKGASQDLRNMAGDAGITGKVLAEQKKSISYGWDQLKAQTESVAISVGSKVIPAASKGLAALSHLSSGTAITIGGALAPLAAMKVGNIVAASSAFKGLSSSLSLVAGAARLGGLRAIPGAMLSALNPTKALAIAAIAAGGAIAYLATRQSAAARAAAANAAAQRALLSSINGLRGAEGDQVDKRLAYKQATLGVDQAEKSLHDARVQSGKDSLAARQAEVDLEQARKNAGDAYGALLKSQSATETRVNSVRTAANTRLLRATRELQAAQRGASSHPLHGGAMGLSTGTYQPSDSSLKRLAAAQKEYAAASKEFGQAQRIAGLQSVDMIRKQQGVEPIFRKNAASVQMLAAAINGLPKSKQLKILGDNQQALAQAGNLSAKLMEIGKSKTVAKIFAETSSAQAAVLAMRALLKGVPQRTVAKVVGQTSGKQEIAALKALVDSIQSKTVTVTTRTQTISGGNDSSGRTSSGSSKGGGAARPSHAASFGAVSGGGILAAASRAFSGTGGLALGAAKTTEDENPITGQIESHTPAEWAKIRLKYKHSKTLQKKAKARQKAADRKFQGSFDRFDQLMSSENVGVAAAALTQDTADDIAALTAEQASRAKRIKTLRNMLKDKRIKGSKRQQVNDSLAQLLQDTADTNQTISDLQNPPATPADNPFNAVINGDEANVVAARVNGGDVTGAIQAELTDAINAFADAQARGNADDMQTFGNLVLQLRQDLQDNTTAVQANTDTSQALLEVTQTALDNANAALATSQAEMRAMGQYITGIVARQIGAKVGRGRTTPVPLAGVSR